MNLWFTPFSKQIFPYVHSLLALSKLVGVEKLQADTLQRGVICLNVLGHSPEDISVPSSKDALSSSLNPVRTPIICKASNPSAASAKCVCQYPWILFHCTKILDVHASVMHDPFRQICLWSFCTHSDLESQLLHSNTLQPVVSQALESQSSTSQQEDLRHASTEVFRWYSL